MFKFSTIDHTGALRLHQPTSVRKVPLTSHEGASMSVWAVRNPRDTGDILYYIDAHNRTVYEVYVQATQYHISAHPVGRLLHAPTETY